MASPEKSDDERRDEVLRQMLKMPHKPHSEIVGKKKKKPIGKTKPGK